MDWNIVYISMFIILALVFYVGYEFYKSLPKIREVWKKLKKFEKHMIKMAALLILFLATSPLQPDSPNFLNVLYKIVESLALGFVVAGATTFVKAAHNIKEIEEDKKEKLKIISDKS
ncbi:hypothetical protein C9J03_11980 [Photobacterium gaetbulicola]|uniref:hypothetical protein n=1 Tax=Photobacterium gaetbulicola TaxID=1295392 RepID=UPI0005CBE430|nr:hypothetical protein [Photobacterium gaetbulicola]PSU10302.1 hypothetical protein C9J03_11980 [Photobacterium gaetbulicola]